MKKLLACLLLLSAPAWGATERDSLSLTNPMVADISQSAIEIRANFNGTQLLVFGAQNMPGELAIAVRGPAAPITVRRKERTVHFADHGHRLLPAISRCFVDGQA